MSVFQTFADTLPPQRTNGPEALRVFLGPPPARQSEPEEQPDSGADTGPDTGADTGAEIFIDEPHKVDVGRLAELTPQLMRNGLDVVVNTATRNAHPEPVERVLRIVSFLFCKYVHYPRSSGNIPDPHEMRKGSPLHNSVARLQWARNAPLHFFSPLADQLQRSMGALAPGLPVVVALPGPSLKAHAPQLADLSRHALVVAISRALPMCLRHGVVPDVVVQLDSSPAQRLFYPADADLSNSTLIALTLADVSTVAPRFGSTFFMQSFDTKLLANPYRMRESWLSSLFSAMGAAEVLHASRIYLTGVDLSYPTGNRYSDAADSNTPAQKMQDVVALPRSDVAEFQVPDRSGQPRSTTLGYYATAAEAEMFARAMHAATGVEFFLLGNEGILPATVFSSATPADITALPPLDRDPLYQARTHARTRLPMFETAPLVEKRLKRAHEVEEYGHIFDYARLLPDMPPETLQKLDTNPIYRTLVDRGKRRQYLHFVNENELLQAATVFAHAWARALKQSAGWAHLRHAVNTRAPVPMLCLQEERAEAAAHLAHILPGIRLRPLVLVTDPAKKAERGVSVLAYELPGWLTGRRAVLCAHGAWQALEFERPLLNPAVLLPLHGLPGGALHKHTEDA